MLLRKTDQDPDEFWRDYEVKIGEKVLARSLGQYLSGWEEFDSKGLTRLWGLVISTKSGFRFHHFPQQNWLDSFSRSRQEPDEKIFIIPRERLISAQLVKETCWWKKIFKSPSPQLIVSYRNEAGEEKRLLLEADLIHGDLAESLNDKLLYDKAATAAPNSDACSTGTIT